MERIRQISANGARLALLIAVTLGLACQASSGRSEVVRLYDAGRYEEARAQLEQLDAAGKANGSMLYRLYYCQRVAGETSAEQTLQRARARLEEEIGDDDSLEAPFYLANAYQNLGLGSSAQRVASDTTTEIESGERPEPDDGLDMFRLGKLYADQGRDEDATRWYREAIDSLDSDPDDYAAYLSWAGRHLAEPAFIAGEYESAARFYGYAVADDRGTAQDYDRLATALVRTGRYDEASKAWKTMAGLSPLEANRARYLSSLSAMAAKLETLPETDASGLAWSDLSKDDLESSMRAQAESLREMLTEARAAQPLEEDVRQDYLRRIADAQSAFVAAGLTHGIARYGIREAAFFGGYAPLILQRHAWRLKIPKADRGEKKRKGTEKVEPRATPG